MTGNILITGATGKTGAALVRLFRASQMQVRAATRNPLASGDVRFEWRDQRSHQPALQGVTSVYLVAPTDATEHLPIMRPFLETALATGIERFVLLSASVLEQGAPMMGEVHAWLADHTSQWTVLRPSWFMQNFITQHLPSIMAEGAIYTVTGDGRVPFIDASDIAVVAKKALTDPDFGFRRAPILTGPETLSYDEVAAAISSVTGRPVRHIKLTVEEMVARYEGFGLPRDYAAVLAGLDQAIAEGVEDRITDDVEKLSGQKSKDFASFLEENIGAFSSV
ncbi:MAG: NmrA family NAD(P)-binding protein [Sphingobium sp.]|nr:NmrA family NAD(P)-binding protein [Sphingobium sp.]MBP9157938.1 NmrA family NAD(P)-binding protein [Sphingobium sp.]